MSEDSRAEVAGRRIESIEDLDYLDFTKEDGLVPLIAQHQHTGEVLMLGYTNREALARSLESRQLWFWSRQRQRLWKKGESSGNTLALNALFADCDADAVLAQVIPAGPTCHTGATSCFEAPPSLAALGRILAERAATPSEGSYTAKLLGDENLRHKKLGEEAVELVMACTARDNEKAAEEAADLIYHTLTACQAIGVGLEEVIEALAQRLPR